MISVMKSKLILTKIVLRELLYSLRKYSTKTILIDHTPSRRNKGNITPTTVKYSVKQVYYCYQSTLMVRFYLTN